MSGSGLHVLNKVKYQVHQTILSASARREEKKKASFNYTAEWEIPPNASLGRDVYTAVAPYENEL